MIGIPCLDVIIRLVLRSSSDSNTKIPAAMTQGFFVFSIFILDEMGGDPFFINRLLDAFLFSGLHAFQNPGHVAGQGAHGLQTFLVLQGIFPGETVNLVPVLGTGDDHIIHEEILQRAVELAKAAYIGDLTSQVSLGQVSGTNMGVLANNR